MLKGGIVVVKGGLRRSSARGSYLDLGGLGIGHSSIPMQVGLDVSIMIG
jgi:hypothetical protein